MRSRLGGFATLILSMTLLLSACGGSTTASSSGTNTGAAGGFTVRVGQFSWSAAMLTNTILEGIAQQKPGLGVSGFKTTQLDPATAWAGAGRGDIDLMSEVELPNQQKFVDSAKDKMQVVGQTYGDAQQGWFVPKYAVEPGGPAAGLTSVAQLNDFSKVFGGKLYDQDPGFVTTEQNTKRLKGYGITYEHVISSTAAELAQLKRATDRKEPIVLYLSHPDAVFAEYDLVQLKEPNPYTPDCLTTGSGACAMPAYSAHIAASDTLKGQAPKFVALLGKIRISVAEMEQMQKAVDVEKKTPTAVAGAWITSHQQQIDSWSAQ